MKPLVLIGLACFPFYAGADHFHEMTSTKANRIVDAIYRVEGGPRARVPYGILSVKVSGYAEARRVCYNTVVNNHQRWVQAGKPADYLTFLGRRFCPPSADPVGHRNWMKNIRSILKADEK